MSQVLHLVGDWQWVDDAALSQKLPLHQGSRKRWTQGLRAVQDQQGRIWSDGSAEETWMGLPWKAIPEGWVRFPVGGELSPLFPRGSEVVVEGLQKQGDGYATPAFWGVPVAPAKVSPTVAVGREHWEAVQKIGNLVAGGEVRSRWMRVCFKEAPTPAQWTSLGHHCLSREPSFQIVEARQKSCVMLLPKCSLREDLQGIEVTGWMHFIVAEGCLETNSFKVVEPERAEQIFPGCGGLTAGAVVEHGSRDVKVAEGDLPYFAGVKHWWYRDGVWHLEPVTLKEGDFCDLPKPLFASTWGGPLALVSSLEGWKELESLRKDYPISKFNQYTLFLNGKKLDGRWIQEADLTVVGSRKEGKKARDAREETLRQRFGGDLPEGWQRREDQEVECYFKGKELRQAGWLCSSEVNDFMRQEFGRHFGNLFGEWWCKECEKTKFEDRWHGIALYPPLSAAEALEHPRAVEVLKGDLLFLQKFLDDGRLQALVLTAAF